MISVADAIRIVREQTSVLPGETVSLAEARGRFLAEDVVADCDLPPFDRAQMDGYALRAADVQTTPAKLKIVGESAAGRGWHHELKTGEAVRIMTGAPVPRGADSVQQVELTRELSADAVGQPPSGEIESRGEDGNKVAESVEVEILETVAHGRSIVARGNEIRAGETVLRAGEQITAASMAVLASFGYAQIKVGQRPRVAVLATGSELVTVDEKPGQDQIRDSNNYSIGAYAELAGAVVERLPLAGDDTSLLRRQIGEAAERGDTVITSGGVSVGAYDFTRPALRELGAEVFFERVALRPGKPAVFARLPNGTLFFGLPGNPVSVSVTFNLFARTALLAMQGAKDPALREDWALLERAVKRTAERESYLPAELRTTEAGTLMAQPLKWGGSSDFVGFVRATSMIVVPAGTGPLEVGTRVRVVRLPV
jgi:molybdopterin molybdotransferase